MGEELSGEISLLLPRKMALRFLRPTREELDLSLQGAVSSYLSIHKPDIVIHSAGLVGGIQANIAAPYNFCYENLQIGLNAI